ncbi:MAG: ATP-binding protein [Clostridia bacterium]|nr:ATP-binding protein [Clostridia bacterium]
MIRKVFRHTMVTQIVSSMTVMICMLVDSMMIGRFLGVDSMTAYGLAMPVLLVFAAFGSMLSAGVQVMCGKAMGSGSKDGMDACYTVSVVLTIAFSGVGLLALLVFLGPICTMLGAGPAEPSNEIFRLTKDYIRGFVIGAPAFLFAQIMVPFLQFSGQQTRVVVGVGAMTVSDILFDILNVFVFRGGTFGMGLASSLSYYISFAVGVLFFVKPSCMFRLRFRLVDKKTCSSVLKYGVPTVINQICMVLLVFVLNNILLEVGQSRAVASYSVISTIGNICYCVGSGIGSVALMLASLFYTDEDRTSLYDLIRTMMRYTVILNLALTVVVLLAAPILVPLFLTDASAKSMAILGMRLFCLSLLPSALNAAFKSYFQGVNRLFFSEAISVMQNFVFTSLFAFILSRFLGTTGVWLCFLCGETLTFLVICAAAWIRHRSVTLDPTAFSFLQNDFGVKEGDYIEMSVRSAEESVAASRKAEAFCLEHGESERNSSMIALCVEEMTENIVRHGFPKDKNENMIDIRLIFKNGQKVIRIRDNCVSFDPLKYLELHETDDPTKHFGIRMVMKMVKNADFVYSLGMNNLTLVL